MLPKISYVNLEENFLLSQNFTHSTIKKNLAALYFEHFQILFFFYVSQKNKIIPKFCEHDDLNGHEFVSRLCLILWRLRFFTTSTTKLFRINLTGATREFITMQFFSLPPLATGSDILIVSCHNIQCLCCTKELFCTIHCGRLLLQQQTYFCLDITLNNACYFSC
jgi:hypothetical protein